MLVQSRRNAKAARRLMRKLLKGQGRAPRVMITDKLGSYAVAGKRRCRASSIVGIRGLITEPKTPTSRPDDEKRS